MRKKLLLLKTENEENPIATRKKQKSYQPVYKGKEDLYHAFVHLINENNISGTTNILRYPSPDTTFLFLIIPSFFISVKIFLF